uniref:Protein huluwa-like n=1 Tax=Gouania willdenowi TaxID=441366 RepID=A0A8C5N8Z7_GOUWI
MSSSGQTGPSDPGEGQPVNSLTVVVLLLIPCVVILLLLNCVFLLYKLLRTRTRTRDHPQELLLQHRRASGSQSEHPVTSSRASSRDHCRVPLLLTSVRAPSTIRATSPSAPRLTLRPEPPPGPGSPSCSSTKAGWCRSVSLRILSADSDALLTSALEWDYYDPCYVKQNHLPKHQHHRPALHTKHYWV